jgi:octaprenyl-diphosphate synthase
MGLALRSAMSGKLVMRGCPLADDYTAYFGEPRGKTVRGTLTLMFTQMIADDFHRGLSAASAVELLHLAAMVVDDWMDNAQIRHGKQTVVYRYGPRTAFAVARHLLYRSFMEFASYRSKHLLQRAQAAVDAMVAGQRLETRKRDGTWEAYCECIFGKTASLFGLACEAGAVIANERRKGLNDARGFGHNVGMAFQIFDDYLDFFGTTEFGKRVGKDFLSGVNSAPILLFSAQSPSHARRIRNLMSAPFRTMDQFEELRDDMLRDGIGYATLAAAKKYTDRANQRLESFPDVSHRTTLMSIANSLTIRTL